MITSEPTPRTDGTTAGSDRPVREPSSDLPLTRLRGAGVDIDPRRAGRLVVAVCLLAAAVIAVVLFVAGVQKNAQTTSLRDHGVPVAVTVKGCLGLLGGSGSNAAGYACKGTYTFAGHRYEQDIPGSASLRPGAVISGVIVRDDPDLLSTPGMVASEQASWRVFIAPIILFIVFVLLTSLVLLARRRNRCAPEAGVKE
jgi:hypothetical protein